MAREAPLLRRGLLATLIPLLLLSLGGVVISYFIAAGISRDVYDRTLIDVAHELSLHLSIADGTARLALPPAAERLLLLDQRDKISYRVSTADGKTIAGDSQLPPPPSSLAAEDEARYRGVLHGKPVSMVHVRVAAPGMRPLVVQVAETNGKRSALVQKILLSIVLPQVLLILVALLLVWVGVGQKLSSLRRLRQAVENRSHLDLSPISENDVPGEVRPLLHALNGLMIRLHEVVTFQTRFIADAAHQLRTPVAGLKTNIEVMLRETDTAAMQQSLGQIYQSVGRLSRLVSQLLSLARNEPSSARVPDLAPLDLNQMMLNLAAEWVPEAYRKGIDLGFEGTERKIIVEADAISLKELANNLLDNAVRYTRSGGRVTVRVSSDGQSAFSVSDDGPRIPPEERDRIFERFHRLLGTQVDGSGLGLAIVREIAALHGAEVMLTDDTDGVGNRFTVLFPVADLRRSQRALAPAGVKMAG